jgi:hypothetical protein
VSDEDRALCPLCYTEEQALCKALPEEAKAFHASFPTWEPTHAV